MNYEKAWNHLKDFIETITEVSTQYAKSEYKCNNERLRYEGRENMGRKILNFMAFSEKEMATADDTEEPDNTEEKADE